MSTFFATLAGVAVAILMSMVFIPLMKALSGLFVDPATGGAAGLGLVTAGFFAFQTFSASYIGCRIFRKSNALVVAWAIAILAVAVRLGAAVSLWDAGPTAMVVWITLTGVVASVVGATVGAAVAGSDRKS